MFTPGAPTIRRTVTGPAVERLRGPYLYIQEQLRDNGPPAWAEFCVDEMGWVPTDPTFGRLSGCPEAFFARLPSDRFAFSYDLDVPMPGYGGAVRLPPLGSLLSPLWLGSRHFRWGAQTLEGTVPHLQPAYARVYPGWGPDFFLSPPANGVWSSASPQSAFLAAGPQVGGLLALGAICVIALSDLVGSRPLSLLGWALVFITVMTTVDILRRQMPS